MEKKFYEMPELKVVDLEGEMLLADSNDPDGVEQDTAGTGGVGSDDDEAGAKRIFDWD